MSEFEYPDTEFLNFSHEEKMEGAGQVLQKAYDLLSSGKAQDADYLKSPFSKFLSVASIIMAGRELGYSGYEGDYRASQMSTNTHLSNASAFLSMEMFSRLKKDNGDLVYPVHYGNDSRHTEVMEVFGWWHNEFAKNGEPLMEAIKEILSRLEDRRQSAKTN